MRLLMLNNEFPPLGGGTGTVNKAMLQCFANVPGLEIDLVTSALGKVFERQCFASNIEIYKVPVRNWNIHHSSNRELIEFALRALPLAMKLHRQNPYELCFAWSAVPAGAAALGLKRLIGLHYIVRVCGPDIPGFERRYRTIHLAIAPLIRRIWRGAEQVIAKSEREIEMIRAVDASVNCLTIPNGVDLSRFKPGDSVPDNGPLNLLCVGRQIERKGQHHLIEAVKRLTDEGIDVKLELVGSGDAQPANEALVNRLGLAGRVHFRGYVPREQIARYYAAAHVFVLPSYNEGMSVALLEAMAAGLPAVVTPAGGTPELVQPEVNGLIFNWAAIGELTNHIRRLAQDRELARRMGEASRRRAAEFSWDRAAQRYVKIFTQLGSIPSDSESHLTTEAKQKV